MPLETISREALGRAAYDYARAQELDGFDLDVESPWDEATAAAQERWNGLAEAVLTHAGLHALAEGRHLRDHRRLGRDRRGRRREVSCGTPRAT